MIVDYYTNLLHSIWKYILNNFFVMETLFNLENLINFTTLSGLEIVLGVDNIIFLAIVVHHLPAHRRDFIRLMGLSLAIILRIIMLFGVSWLMTLTEPIITILEQEFSGRSLLLLAGGLFLIVKSLAEFHEIIGVSHKQNENLTPAKQPEWRIILQIIFIDLILSFDSVIVAVGMVNNLYLIITAILLAMIVMLVCSKAIGEFMYHNPSIKVIGLAFIMLVGVFLMGDGIGIELPKGYLYFAMFFSLFVETFSIKLRNNQKKLEK